MALQGRSTALNTEDVLFLGHSDPEPYDAGNINGKPFDGGYTMKIAVGFDDINVAMLKVRGKNFQRIYNLIENLERLEDLTITYRDADTSKRGDLPELTELVVHGQAAKLASAG